MDKVHNFTVTISGCDVDKAEQLMKDIMAEWDEPDQEEFLGGGVITWSKPQV